MDETADHPSATPEEGKEVECAQVKRLKEAYDAARKFDRSARTQYAKDRRYAAGTVDSSWVVDTNLIGSYIDILCSYLYARDPDVCSRPAEVVERAEQPGLPPVLPAAPMQPALPGLPQPVDEAAKRKSEMQDFARGLEIVISRLWKNGKLKKVARKQVRSALSVGPGWLKVVMLKDTRRDPQVETALNDARDNLMRLQAKRKEITEGDPKDMDVELAEMELLIQGLEAKVEVILRKGLAIDFVAAEDMQVSLDVRELDDHLEADWNANAIYIPKAELGAKFPTLTQDKIKQAACYYQRRPQDIEGDYQPDSTSHKDAEAFVQHSSGNADEVEFAKVIELWDRRDNLIKTMVDGIDCWAKPPFAPPYASSRFYPYFLLAFGCVDGQRHPQSLSWRLRKLQDEYAATRSSFRETRRRSIPGVLFNAEQVGPDAARKIEQGSHQEFIGLKTTNPNVPFRDLFAEKPTARIDPALFDVTPILRDMEKISGVQEAQQQSIAVDKTATEAEIQNQGFQTRTNADRDYLETMLDELAQYTAEVALQCLTLEDVQRMAGPEAYWPHGMDIEDLLTLVEVEIDAGSTGKPNTSAEREAWSVALPLIREVMTQIQQAEATGNQPMALALRELLRETLRRLDDRVDVERFIPQMPATPVALPGAAPVGAPGGVPTDQPLQEVA